MVMVIPSKNGGNQEKAQFVLQNEVSTETGMGKWPWHTEKETPGKWMNGGHIPG